MMRTLKELRGAKERELRIASNLLNKFEKAGDGNLTKEQADMIDVFIQAAAEFEWDILQRERKVDCEEG